uniref:Putative Histidinol-phosphate aminotransferase (Imidazole acetol-phosphate transaminase) n=1 Tax=mine drainage metagenome TaxID=410659 RepID=E6Q876_9ZZZZ
MHSAETVLPVHGGDIASVAARYGASATELLDFSVNVNPLGAPHPVLAYLADTRAIERALGAYPERNSSRLKDAVRARYGVPTESIVVGNGSAALLDAALRALPPTRCLVPVPAFSEYRRALHACGHTWGAIPLESENDFRLDLGGTIDALHRERPGALILTNPHNPSGALCTREALLEIVRAASAVKCTVLLDEAFIDYAPEESLLAEAAATENLFVLRSVTKFYAMPALRVGYAVSAPRFARRVEAALPSWPVSGIAVEAAARALGDRAFERRSVARNAELRGELAHHLGELGVRVLPSAANFLLLELPASWGARASVCERLVRSWGIVVRDCGDYEGLADRTFVRVGIKDRASNQRLLAAFRSLSEMEKSV